MFKRASRILITAAIATAVLALAGCNTSIGDITKDPAKFANKDVTISGTASNSFGAMGAGVFQVDDGTGNLWVYGQNFGVPGNGAKVSITGRIEQGFSFGGKSYGLILRQTQDRH